MGAVKIPISMESPFTGLHSSHRIQKVGSNWGFEAKRAFKWLTIIRLETLFINSFLEKKILTVSTAANNQNDNKMYLRIIAHSVQTIKIQYWNPNHNPRSQQTKNLQSKYVQVKPRNSISISSQNLDEFYLYQDQS